jgi:hypothetical protein
MHSIQPDMSVPEMHHSAQPIAKSVYLAQSPTPCRCGRYLSEDFEGRLFCRGCEGTDAADITPRLPLCPCSQ